MSLKVTPCFVKESSLKLVSNVPFGTIEVLVLTLEPPASDPVIAPVSAFVKSIPQ